jgi:phosphohistidine phosphatase
MKTLYLIRHAKSSWKNAGLSDFERPLNSRGRNDAPIMGERLKKDNIIPDVIISSPAKRAWSTSRIIAKNLNISTDSINLNSDIYEANASTLLKIINQINDKYEKCFMFGHNPGITYFAELLTNTHFGNVPTCGIVGISFDLESWAMISSNMGSCIYYNYPKKIG